VPREVEPHLGPNDTPVGQIFQYTLESDHHDPSQLRSWQDWVVSKRMMRAPGVADVVSFGGFQKEYHVLADVDRLRSKRPDAGRADSCGVDVERRAVGRLRAPGRIRIGGAWPRLSARGRLTSGTPSCARATARRSWCATWRASSRPTRHGGARWRATTPSNRSRGRCCSGAARTRAPCCWRFTTWSKRSRRASDRDAHRHVLRSHATGGHHAEDGVAQHARGHRPGQRGDLAVPARVRRIVRGVADHAAGAAGGLRRAPTTRASPPICCRWARSTSGSCWRGR